MDVNLEKMFTISLCFYVNLSVRPMAMFSLARPRRITALKEVNNVNLSEN